MEYVWYLGYGSNLCQERFNHYILGGRFRLGGSNCKVCSDKTLPQDNKPIMIPHSLFFAKSASGWGNGGVAFISQKTEHDKKNYTYGRMWKITGKQYLEIWNQEGRGWYNKELNLGNDDDISIVTITSSVKLEPNKPSNNYLKTISIGLQETFQLDSQTISDYLMEKPGIKGNFTNDDLLEIINSN